ncbi:MAG: LamG domain-containing protein, partial [Desulfobacterales bacterium]|nr:LamG domain-containing protein [Desulfobacterales bacterium]
MSKNLFLSFDGKDDYIELVDAPSLGLTNRDFTVEAWVNVRDAASDEKAVLGVDQCKSNIGLHLVIRNNRPYMGFYGNDTKGRTELAAGVWCHIAWRYSKTTGEQAIFVNGILDAASPNHAPFQGTGRVHIGRWGGMFGFKGFISELRIWSRARSAREILANMNRRLKGDEPDLAGCWPLDRGPGDETRDVGRPSGALEEAMGNPPGVFHGSPAWEDAGRPIPLKTEKVVRFNGRGDHLSFGKKIRLEEKYTIEGWFNTRSNESQVVFAAHRGAHCRVSIHLDNGVIGYAHKAPPGEHGGADIYSRRTYADGSWHHFAAVKNPWVMTLYMDGEAVWAVACDHSISDRVEIVIGGARPDDASRFFKGELGEIRVWRGARAPGEIVGDMRRRLTGDPKGLAAYWPLDEASGAVARDAAPAPPLDGVVTGGAWTDHAPPTPTTPTPGAAPAPAKAPACLTLDGRGGHIRVNDHPDLRISEYTVEAWIHPEGPPNETW